MPDRRQVRLRLREHLGVVRQAVALAQIAARACGQDVLPCRLAAARAWHDMVEGQLLRMEAVAAILTAEAVAQEHVEPREGRPLRRRHVFLQRNDARQPELAARRMDAEVVFREYRNAGEEDRKSTRLNSSH